MRSNLLYAASQLAFSKGPKQPPPPTRVSDNLRSQDTVEVLLGLGEGPWSKLHDGLKSFYIANTPLMASDGTLNFPDAQLIFHKGTEMPDPVQFLLGGSAAGTGVGVNLAQNAPVTRTTTSGEIDAIDVRLRIDQLMKNTDEGDQLNEDLLFRIEVKPTSSGTWQSLPPNTGWVQNWTAPEPSNNNTGFFGSLIGRIEQLQIDQQLSQYDAEVQAWQEYQDNADGPIDTSLGVTAYAQNIRIYGRTQSPVMKEIRIPVQRLTTDTYDIRVTKISAESTGTSVREITWDTFEEITIGDKAYPNTAMAQVIVQASDQLSNVPAMYGIYDTTEVLVPTIFDPETRSYDFSGGPWDGTFKKVFTDDLAWIIYDLIHNDEHGIATYYPIGFSKYEALEASIYWNACDPVTGAYVGIPRPNGGTRPRVTFNGLIDQPRNSMELLLYMAGAGNAVFYEDVEGNFRLKVEQDTPATQTFNNMDIENGRFQYSFTDINTRYNDITVVYRNKKLPAYQEDRRRVFSQSDIDTHGRKPITFVAVGCVDTDEAIARAYHKMLTALTETRQVSFTTTRFGAYVEPHDIILIADEAMDEGYSRRCIGLNPDRRTVTLNEALALESGVTDYVVRLQTTDGIWETQVLENNVDTTPTTLRLADAIPTGLDDNFSFSIASATEGDLRPYRVISIDEGDDGDEKIKISAVEVNRAKYGLIDNFDGTSFDVDDEPDISSPESKLVIDLQAVVTERATVDGKVKDINVTWDAPATTTAGAIYSVKYSYNDEVTREVYRGSNLQFIQQDVPIGTHTFTVSTVNLDGTDSPQTRRVRVTTLPPDYGLPAITGVTIQNKKDSDTTYIGKNVSIEWSVDTSEQWEGWASDKPHPDFSWWEIDVVDNSNGSIVHTYQLTDWGTKQYTVPYSDFSTFGLSNIRDFSLVVSVSDSEGNEGASFSRTIEKPTQVVSNVTITQQEQHSLKSILKYDVPVDPDFKGLKVWVSASDNAHLTGTLVWEGEGYPVLDLLEGTNYISYQTTDSFGHSEQPITKVTKDTTYRDVLTEMDEAQIDIDDLITTYGSTATAATSAAAALASESAAQTAEQNASTAQAQAEQARDDAQAAEVSATESAGVSVSVARSQLPSTFEDADLYFTHDLGGSPDTVQDVSASSSYSLINDATEGAGVKGNGNGDFMSTKGVLPAIVGNTYRVRVKVRENTAPTDDLVSIRFNYLYDDYSYYSGNQIELTGLTNTVSLVGEEFVMTQALANAGVRWLRGGVSVNTKSSGSNDGDWDFFLLEFEDITQEKNAEISANAAATSEFNAGVSETNAGQSANAAQLSETNAATSEANASSSETNAAISETNAAGSASAASSSETNAANSQTAAGASAAAAAGSASTAESEANDAEQSASAAQSSSVTASTASEEALRRTAQNLPSTFENADDYFVHNLTGSPETNADVTSSVQISAITDPVEGAGLKGDGNGEWIISRYGLPAIAGNTYKVTVRGREVVTPTNDRSTVGCSMIREDWSYHSQDFTQPSWTSSAYDYTHEFTVTQAQIDAGVKWIKPIIGFNTQSLGSNDGIWEYFLLKIEDITSQKLSESAASASAASAASALVSETSAGQSAQAAQTSETNASTSESNAAVSAGNAATSESNAAGSAAAAVNSENISVSASNAAILTALDSLPYQLNRREFFSSGLVGSPNAFPENLVELSTSDWLDVTDPDLGAAIQSDGKNYCSTKAFIPVTSDRLKISMKYKAIQDDTSGTTNRVTTFMYWYDGNGIFISSRTLVTFGTFLVSDGVKEVNYQFAPTDLSPPAGAVYFRPYFFNNVSSNSGNGVARFSIFKIENIENTEQAADSASAALSSEQAAAVSATDAGTFATAADNSRISAETAESNASISETNSATSATSAAGSAAAAETFLQLSAKIKSGAINDNSTFSNYETDGLPPDWITYGQTLTNSFVESGLISPNAMRQIGPAGQSNGLRQTLENIKSEGYYVLEADVVLNSGTFAGSGIYISYRNSANAGIGNEYLPFNNSPDETGVNVSGGIVGKRYRFSKLIKSVALTDSIYFYLMTHWSNMNGGDSVQNEITWHQCSIRPATTLEIEAGKVVDLQASVTQNAAAIATHDGQLQARLELGVATPNAEAFVRAVADETIGGTAYSSVALGGDVLAIYNPVEGTWQEAVRVSGGNIRILGNLEAGAGIFLGTGASRWALALQNRVYYQEDGDTISFGQDIGDYEVDFSPLGLDELSSGESYRLRAINRTGTGFDCELKIVTTGTTTSVTESTNATSPSGPEQMVAKADSSPAYNDAYTFKVNGQVSVFAFNEPELGGIQYTGTYSLQTWFHDGTSWVEGPTIVKDYSDLGVNPNHSSGPQNYSFTNQNFVVNYTNTIRTSSTLGTFGASNPNSGTITDLVSVSYTKQGQSGTRSATPDGQTCKITVRPTNEIS